MSVNGALSDDEWGAWGKPEAATKLEEIETNHNDAGNGFVSDDNSANTAWNNNGASKFKSNNQDNFGKSYQEKRGGYNGNRGGNDSRFSSKRDDDTDNRYKRDGRNNYNNRNNYERDNNKRDDSRENRGGYRNQKRDSSKENRNNYQRDDRSNGYKRDDSRENRSGYRNTRKDGFKRDDSEENRGNYRNPRKNDYKRDDSPDNRSKYHNKNDPFKRDDSSENRSNYRKPNRRDDSDDSRKNYRNSKKDRDDSRERNSYRNNDRRNDSRERRRRDDSREKRSYYRDDDRNDDYRRNDSRERRRNDSRERPRNNSRERRRTDSRERKRSDTKRDFKRDDSSDSDCKGRRGRDGPSQNRNRDVDDLSDKFDKNTRLDNNNDGFSSRTFIRGHKTSEHDNQTDDAAVPKRATFIPNDDQADYELHVNCGINFDNYDKIPVEVTGENAPPSIASFSELSLPEFLTANIDSLKYAKLTPVQKYAIPIIDTKRDLMACAQTGSGKTAAFLIPIIKSIHENTSIDTEAPAASQVAFPKALIMAPTRELCRQIFTAARHLCRGSNVKCAYIYGGIEMNKSRRNIQSSGCDILVATPGRLIHFLELVWISLRYMKFFVLDEADRMLDSEGFYESVNKIYTDAVVVGEDRTIQISMFSATFPNEIQSLARNLLKNYLFLAVGVVGSANSDVKQEIIAADQRDKVNTAIEYIKSIPDEKTLIFVESKRMADFFGVKLGYLGFKATTIHGDREQEQREIALNDFKSGRVNFMVATNVAARGLDIPKVDNVINIDMPGDIDTYVHRIGRTGRCGNVGRAVSFFDETKDIGLASALVSKLEEANQEVADWLRLLASGAAGATGYGGGGARRNNYTRDTRRDVPVSKFVDNPNDEFMKGTNVDYEDAKPSSEWLED